MLRVVCQVYCVTTAACNVHDGLQHRACLV